MLCFRTLWSVRAYIHVNLCLTLMASQLLFVSAIDKTGNMVYIIYRWTGQTDDSLHLDLGLQTCNIFRLAVQWLQFFFTISSWPASCGCWWKVWCSMFSLSRSLSKDRRRNTLLGLLLSAMVRNLCLGNIEWYVTVYHTRLQDCQLCTCVSLFPWATCWMESGTTAAKRCEYMTVVSLLYLSKLMILIHYRCWLRYDTHFIWAFIAPVILIIVVSNSCI